MIIGYSTSWLDNLDTCSFVLQWGEHFEILDTTDKTREQLQLDKSNFFSDSFFSIFISWLWFQGHNNWYVNMFFCSVVGPNINDVLYS